MLWPGPLVRSYWCVANTTDKISDLSKMVTVTFINKEILRPMEDRTMKSFLQNTVSLLGQGIEACHLNLSL